MSSEEMIREIIREELFKLFGYMVRTTESDTVEQVGGAVLRSLTETKDK